MHKKLFCLALLLLIVSFSGHAFGLAYAQTKDINITAPATLDLNNQFTIVLDLNTTITGQLTDNVDYNDIGIFYNDTNLARRVEKYGANARVYFRVPAGLTILRSTSNSNFSLKYDSDVNISTPFINDANVFLRWFDFNGAAVPANFLSANATIVSGTLRIVDGAAWGDAYAFVNDMNFKRDWGATIESDINVGVKGGSNFGFNDGSGSTNNDMNTAHYLAEISGATPLIIQGDATISGFGIPLTANQNIHVKVGGRLLTGASFYHTFDLTTFDFNRFYQSNNPSTNIVRLGVTVKPDNDTSTNFDNWKLYHDANAVGAIISLIDTNALTANIDSNVSSPLSLDPENGVNAADVNFSANITKSSDINIVAYSWMVDGVSVSSASNFVRSFNSLGDFNVSLIVDGNNTDSGAGLRSQKDLNFLVRNNLQGVDINFTWNVAAQRLDVNYGVVGVGVINYAVWGFPQDQNLPGLQVSKFYREGDVRDVCVTINTTGDLNKTKCERFYDTRVIAKIPKNISTLDNATPFTATANIIPIQAYSSVSVDQNFWFFYTGNPDTNTYNLTIDANVGYFISTYLIGLNATDLNKTIQPYVVPVTDGINVVFTGLDSLTNDIVPTSVLFFNRNISGQGNVLVNSGITDATGRIAFPFIANVDHNFTIQFPFGITIKTGNYIPQSGDSISVIIPTSSTGSTTITGVADVDFLQDRAEPKPNGSVDLNQIVTTSRTISSIRIAIDHNGVTLFNDLNSVGVSNGGHFGQNIDVNGRSSLYPLDINVTVTFTDGNTTIFYHSVAIVRIAGLPESFEDAKDELGDTGGTMILAAIIIAIILGGIHWGFPEIDQSYTFVLGAAILAFLAVVNWVDGISWVLATIAAGATYFMRRVDR